MSECSVWRVRLPVSVLVVFFVATVSSQFAYSNDPPSKITSPNLSSGSTPYAAAAKTRKELVDLVSEWLRCEAIAETENDRYSAAIALCDIYVTIKLDSRYADSEWLQQTCAKVRRRLLSISNRATRLLKRNDLKQSEVITANTRRRIAEVLRAKSTSKSLREETRLTGDNDEQNPSSPAFGSIDNSDDHVPSNFANNSIAGGGGSVAEAAMLIELIQQVISPDFWNSRGGKGSIHYFALKRVLVVRATSDVHEDVWDLLSALR